MTRKCLSTTWNNRQGKAENSLVACVSLCGNGANKACHSAFQEEQGLWFFTEDVSWCSQLTSSWAATESPTLHFRPLPCACTIVSVSVQWLRSGRQFSQKQVSLARAAPCSCLLMQPLGCQLWHERWCEYIAEKHEGMEDPIFSQNHQSWKIPSIWSSPTVSLVQTGCHLGNWFMLKAVSRSLTCCGWNSSRSRHYSMLLQTHC